MHKILSELFIRRHSLLFVAELPSFRAVLPMEVLDEMDAFAREEKERKKEQKDKKSKMKKSKNGS